MDLPLIKSNVTLIIGNGKEEMVDYFHHLASVLDMQGVASSFIQGDVTLEQLESEMDSAVRKGIEYVCLADLNSLISSYGEEDVVSLVTSSTTKHQLALLGGFCLESEEMPTYKETEKSAGALLSEASYVLGYWQETLFPIKMHHSV